MTDRHLRTRIAAVFVLMLAASIALVAVKWHSTWVHDWMPNFIADWTGIFVGVAVIDRLLERDRKMREEAQRRPLRAAALRLLKKEIGELGRVLADADAKSPSPVQSPDDAADGRELASFIIAWATVQQHTTLSIEGYPEWLERLRSGLGAAARRLAHVRDQYAALQALEPSETAQLDALTMTVETFANTLSVSLEAFKNRRMRDEHEEAAEALLALGEVLARGARDLAERVQSLAATVVAASDPHDREPLMIAASVFREATR